MPLTSTSLRGRSSAGVGSVLLGVALLLPGAAAAGSTQAETALGSPETMVGEPETMIGQPEPMYASVTSLYGDLDGLIVTQTPDGTELSTAADVLFDFDSAELRSEARELLEEVSELLAEVEPGEVEVRGHTDGVGSDDYNQDLSTERAEAVLAFLTDRGELADIDFSSEGVGADEPVAEEEDEDGEDLPDGRAQNRRVELRFEADVAP